ncbi:hypothetical protein [Phenylobacterium sp.]|jgi:hypothetical protein
MADQISPLIPAKAGTQIHPESFVGFTWIPTFAGTSGIEVSA